MCGLTSAEHCGPMTSFSLLVMPLLMHPASFILVNVFTDTNYMHANRFVLVLLNPSMYVPQVPFGVYATGLCCSLCCVCPKLEAGTQTTQGIEALIPVSHGKCCGCLLRSVYQSSGSETENNRTSLSITDFLFLEQG